MLEKELDKIHDFQKGKTSELARRIRVAEGSVERLGKEEEAYNAAMAEVGSSRAQAWQHAREESGAPANGNGNGNGNGVSLPKDDEEQGHNLVTSQPKSKSARYQAMLAAVEAG